MKSETFVNKKEVCFPFFGITKEYGHFQSTGGKESARF